MVRIAGLPIWLTIAAACLDGVDEIRLRLMQRLDAISDAGLFGVLGDGLPARHAVLSPFVFVSRFKSPLCR